MSYDKFLRRGQQPTWISRPASKLGAQSSDAELWLHFKAMACAMPQRPVGITTTAWADEALADFRERFPK